MKKLIIPIIAIAVGAIFYAQFSRHKEPEKFKVRIGVIPWPGYDLIHLAQEKGFYAEEGLDVEIIEQSSSINQFTALENGQISALGITLTELIDNNVNWKTKMRVVSILDYSYGGDVILGQKYIKSMQDLRGKKVAVEDTGLGIYMINRALKLSGMVIEDIEVINMDLSSGVKAMNKGTVDGFVCFPPFSVEVMRSVSANIIFDSTKIPEEIVDVFAVSDDLLDNHADVVRGLVSGWNKALDYSKSHPQESYTLMAVHEGMTSKEFENALSDLVIPTINEQKDIFRRQSLNKTAERIMNIIFSKEQLKNTQKPKSFIHENIILSMD